MWLFLHVFFLIGFRNRLAVMTEWFWAYMTREAKCASITGDAEELRDAVLFMEGEPIARVLDNLSTKKKMAANTKN